MTGSCKPAHKWQHLVVLQASEERASEAEARAEQATSAAADLQQHATWQEARIAELQGQVSLPAYSEAELAAVVAFTGACNEPGCGAWWNMDGTLTSLLQICLKYRCMQDDSGTQQQQKQELQAHCTRQEAELAQKEQECKRLQRLLDSHNEASRCLLSLRAAAHSWSPCSWQHNALRLLCL